MAPRLFASGDVATLDEVLEAARKRHIHTRPLRAAAVLQHHSVGSLEARVPLRPWLMRPASAKDEQH